MQNPQAKLRLILDVAYAPTAVTATTLKDGLYRAAESAIGLGLLTEHNTEVTVDEYSMEVVLVEGDDLPEAVQLFQASVEANRALLAGLLGRYQDVVKAAPAPGFEAFLNDKVLALAEDLGSRAANSCTDDSDAQEEAISAAESWVTDNVSADTVSRLAAVLWVMGVYAGTVELTRWLG
ncbi:hypothetical protein [Burkholderia ambifaria]|uniref:hypothetical protein n=1 Tax=Burkholderia ambifaria TaxID=152480 RepID=UPI000F7FB39D|nr:hypothetical protein [Burkholderia ambifaria]